MESLLLYIQASPLMVNITSNTMMAIVSSFPITFKIQSSSPHRQLFSTTPLTTFPLKQSFPWLSTVKLSSSNSGQVLRPVSSSHGENLEPEIERCPPSAKYNPSYWGDYFLSHTPDENEEVHAIERDVLKEKVRMELLSTVDKPMEHLKLIDAIERLGVEYHFKELIQGSLAKVHDNYNEPGHHQDDLYYVSLRFRLLRQHGFYADNDSFIKFTDQDGNFPEALASDIPTILCLYEASHLRVHLEDVLERALSYTTRHLRAMGMQSSNPFNEEIKHALSHPLMRSVVRLDARKHIVYYERDPLHNHVLVKFAKIDFNIYQFVNKKELKELTRWWEGLRYAEKFPFARDRLVECYFLVVGFVEALFEPKDSVARIAIVKVFLLQTAMDDIYDSYGTAAELTALAEAFERWDKRCIEQLPDSMKLFYKTTLEVFDEAENDLIQEGILNHVPYALEEVKAYSRGHFRSFMSREAMNTLSYEEYLKSGVLAIGCCVSVAMVLMTMGEKVQKEELESLSLFPNAVRVVCTMSRIMNDIEGYEADKNEGRVSTVTCYMKQYGVSKEDAFAALYTTIEGSWIDINEEVLRPTNPIRKHIVILSLAIAQVARVMYDGEDSFRMAGDNLKANIARMFVCPIAL